MRVSVLWMSLPPKKPSRANDVEALSRRQQFTDRQVGSR